MKLTSSRPRERRILAVLACCALAISACSSDEEDYVERPVEDIYNKAHAAMLEGNYSAAAKEFDEVERQHPYSVWAMKGQLMSAYSLYEAGKYDDAIVATDRFIQLNPSSRDAPYAYYLKALCYYEQITDVQRDARMTEFALRSLDEVIKRYPETVYARDSKLKLELTQDHLAGKEMEVGRFYLNQAQYLGAINRFKLVVDKYQRTSHVPEALHRLVEAYLALGMKGEAQKTAAILGHNFPGSEWYLDSFALVETGKPPPQDQPGFTRRTMNWLF
jgi:outer membrane protein assembly factor BamD